MHHSFCIRRKDGSRTACDEVVSYDSACQYSVNAGKRFDENFPDVAPLIWDVRWTIPALHVQGHVDDCMYQFGSAYCPNCGHFHGETAEHYWPELNQLGPQVKQMNNGHRQEVISGHHSDWNWKKTMKMSMSLSSFSFKHSLILQRRLSIMISCSQRYSLCRKEIISLPYLHCFLTASERGVSYPGKRPRINRGIYRVFITFEGLNVRLPCSTFRRKPLNIFIHVQSRHSRQSTKIC